MPSGKRATKTSKYEGVLFLLGDRIFAVEHETILGNSITQAILYSSYHTHLAHLIGVQTGAPLSHGRKPGASVVLLEFIGTRIDLRRALASCGLFEDGDPAIDPNILALIANRIPPGNFVVVR